MMNPVSGVSAAGLSSLAPKPTPSKAAGQDFGEAIGSALQAVSKAENEADQLAVAVASGEDRSVSDLMVATSKATLSVELMSQVRNRALEAYQEIMRMQV